MYPSHAVTDEIIAHFKGVDRLAHLLSEAGIVPIKFLGTKTVSPHRASPLADQRLKETIAGKSKVSAVILDDGTLSGKVLRELTQLLQSLGAGEIHTVVLLDRSGLPIHDGIMERSKPQVLALGRANARQCPQLRFVCGTGKGPGISECPPRANPTAALRRMVTTLATSARGRVMVQVRPELSALRSSGYQSLWDLSH